MQTKSPSSSSLLPPSSACRSLWLDIYIGCPLECQPETVLGRLPATFMSRPSVLRLPVENLSAPTVYNSACPLPLQLLILGVKLVILFLLQIALFRNEVIELRTKYIIYLGTQIPTYLGSVAITRVIVINSRVILHSHNCDIVYQINLFRVNFTSQFFNCIIVKLVNILGYNANHSLTKAND